MLLVLFLGCVFAICLGRELLARCDWSTGPFKLHWDLVPILSRIAILLDGYIPSEWLQHRSHSGMGRRGWPVLARCHLPCIAEPTWLTRTVAVPAYAISTQLQLRCSARIADPSGSRPVR